MPAEYKMGEQRGRKRRHEACALDQGDYKIRLSEQLWKKGKFANEKTATYFAL